jgi:rhodanese-related sulfurtransferase
MVRVAMRHDVQRLMDEGAQVVEMLPGKEYEDAHLPGALSIPLGRLRAEAGERLDRSRPVVTYCWDSLCDMSPRGAWVLASLGFTDVYDYSASKADWIGAGLPFEGKRAEAPHLGTLADRSVPTCRLDETVGAVRQRIGEWDICLVANEQHVLLGLVRAEALGLEDDRPVVEVMQEAPQTHRPHSTPAEVLPQLKKSPKPRLIVTNLDGTVVGIVRPEQLTSADEAS